MPPQKPVTSLKQLSQDIVLYDISAIILEEVLFPEDEEWEVYGPPVLSSRLQMVKDILANSLLPSLMQEILNTVLEKDENIEAIVRYIALQLLLVEGVSQLTVGNFPESYYESILEALATSASELEVLDLRGIWIGPENKSSLYKSLRRLHRIRVLTLRYNCDDDILSIIGKHCPNLERLDISGSEHITAEGLNYLCVHHGRTELRNSLQVVDLGGPGSKELLPSAASMLIASLPNLLSLGTYEHMGAAIEHLYKQNPNAQYKLKYMHDVFTSSERMRAIIRTCPELQAIYLDSPKGIAVQHIDQLKKVTELKLHKVRWSDLEILLGKCGNSIRSLFLITVWGQLDLPTLGNLCPYLIRFELHRSSIICSEVSHPTAFKKLKELFIYSSSITTQCVKFFLSQCLFIEHLAFGQCGNLTDASIISNLMDNSLKYVRALWFGLAENLTMRTVEALIEQCPELNSLGNLAAWDISAEDVALLKIRLHLTNTDLLIHEYGQDSDDEEMVLLM